MTIIDFIFFFYMFVGLYMLGLLVLIYLQNRNELFDYPRSEVVPVSVVVPCFNAEKTVGNTLDSVLNLNYPQEMLEIIVVDDKSTDGTVEVVKKYLSKYRNIRLVVNKHNSGGAAEPTNIGVRIAKHDIIAVADDDSMPVSGALRKMLGFLQNDDKTSAVTCAVLARNPRKFMQKLQSIEYAVISWSRKLLDCIDAVYVTPGPFALYKKKRLLEVGLFDTKNLTQDIEIVWRLRAHGYKARMCLDAQVYSETPRKFGAWWRQRIRWNIGGTQTILKHKKLFFRKGMLGGFILPFFSFSLLMGLIGLGLFVYLIFRRFFVSYLATKYSLYGNTAILRLQDLSFNPSLLNYFGVVMFILGGIFTLYGLGVMKESQQGRNGFFNIAFYMVVYLTVYPFIMVVALYKLARGNYSW